MNKLPLCEGKLSPSTKQAHLATKTQQHPLKINNNKTTASINQTEQTKSTHQRTKLQNGQSTWGEHRTEMHSLNVQALSDIFGHHEFGETLHFFFHHDLLHRLKQKRIINQSVNQILAKSHPLLPVHQRALPTSLVWMDSSTCSEYTPGMTAATTVSPLPALSWLARLKMRRYLGVCSLVSLHRTSSCGLRVERDTTVNKTSLMNGKGEPRSNVG